MANYLLLNQPQVFVGLGTLTFTVPTTSNYNVKFSATVPVADPQGDGGGSGTGLGSGAGGGANGFSDGGQGTGNGGVGQGFGTGSGYPQPLASGSNQTAGTAVSSALSVLVKDNGSTIFTAPTLGASQGALEFSYSFQATAAHSITVVLASANASDATLNGVISTTAIGEGL